jgi:hypothetical protein
VSGKIWKLTHPNGLRDIPIGAEAGQARAGREHGPSTARAGCASRVREPVRAGLYYAWGRCWQS